ncbi:hypothetical protein ACX0G9_28495 [Flavitalea flava]
MIYYVVKYSGTFGFIKPWTAVRDGETFSQQFLTPSIVEGIEKKLFPELLQIPGKVTKIQRHRLNYQGIDSQQEKTWSKGGFKAIKKKDGLGRVYYQADNISILNRGILVNPNLYLVFRNKQDAENALTLQICLCRNEDILIGEYIIEMSEKEFDGIDGFELFFSTAEKGFKVGHNRFNENREMFGELKVFGNPIRSASDTFDDRYKKEMADGALDNI